MSLADKNSIGKIRKQKPAQRKYTATAIAPT